jgi:hypothetical protein
MSTAAPEFLPAPPDQPSRKAIWRLLLPWGWGVTEAQRDKLSRLPTAALARHGGRRPRPGRGLCRGVLLEHAAHVPQGPQPPSGEP